MLWICLLCMLSRPSRGPCRKSFGGELALDMLCLWICMLSNCFGGYRYHVISYLVLQLYLLDVDVFHKYDLIVC
jgi:hypothetical protein